MFLVQGGGSKLGLNLAWFKKASSNSVPFSHGMAKRITLKDCLTSCLPPVVYYQERVLEKDVIVWSSWPKCWELK